MQVSNYTIFDRSLYKLNQRKCIKHFHQHNFLINEISNNIAERLEEFSRKFKRTLVYGLFNPLALDSKHSLAEHAYITPELAEIYNIKQPIIFDEEFNICEKEHYDLAISNLSLSFINDLPGALIQYNMILKKGAMFIATLFGPETLKELKDVLIQTDSFFYGGSTPHILPFIDIRDGAALLQRAKFSQVISDSFIIKVKYSSLINLLKDIKGMGYNNCLLNRCKTILTKNYFSKAEEIYKKLYNLEASFEVITITGFKA